MDIITQSITDYIPLMTSALLGKMDTSLGSRMEEIGILANRMILDVLNGAIKALDEEIYSDKVFRKTWKAIRFDPRTVQTTLGSFAFSRRYYRNKMTGEYFYPVDVCIGLEGYHKVCDDVRQLALTACLDLSYAKSGAQAAPGGISKASVGNYLKDILIPFDTDVAEDQRNVPRLFVEADEDHVTLQDGRKTHVKLVYLHEGAEEKGGRPQLKYPLFFTCPLDTKPDRLWEQIDAAIGKRYSQESVESIFLSGDGASWIRAGEDWLYPCVPILDGYHVEKAFTILTAGAVAGIRNRARAALKAGNKERFEEACREIVLQTEELSVQERKRDAARYLLTHWPRIMNRRLPDAQGCSAEGHVSSILSARLSRHPMCWGEENLFTMAQLRVMRANKQPIRYSTLAHNKRILESQTKDVPEKKVRPGYKLSKARQTRIQRAVKTSARSAMVNLPILTNGKTTPLYQALHALSALSSVS